MVFFFLTQHLLYYSTKIKRSDKPYTEVYIDKVFFRDPTIFFLALKKKDHLLCFFLHPRNIKLWVCFHCHKTPLQASHIVLFKVEFGIYHISLLLPLANRYILSLFCIFSKVSY